MPLIKSKSDKAFKSNIKAEMAAGKPQKQAVAIAYSTKNAAKKAIGGRASVNPMDYDSDEDYYNSLKAKGLKAPRPYTQADREAIRTGSMYKAKQEKEKADNAAFYAKNAQKNAEYDKRILAQVNERRKASGDTALDKLPNRKSGGGLYANINAKRERISEGSGEHMRKVGSKGAPSADAFKQSAKTAKMKSGGKMTKSCW